MFCNVPRPGPTGTGNFQSKPPLIIKSWANKHLVADEIKKPKFVGACFNRQQLRRNFRPRCFKADVPRCKEPSSSQRRNIYKDLNNERIEPNQRRWFTMQSVPNANIVMQMMVKWLEQTCVLCILFRCARLHMLRCRSEGIYYFGLLLTSFLITCFWRISNN